MDAQEKTHYEATLSGLEAQRAELDAAIAVIRRMLALPADPPRSPMGPGPQGGNGAATGAYLGMSITEATKKHITAVRKKLSTKDLIDALEAGGLRRHKYNTLYSVLSRRGNKIGDIINMDGDWALAEWYPNRPKPKVAAKVDGEETEPEKDEQKKTGKEKAKAANG